MAAELNWKLAGESQGQATDWELLDANHPLSRLSPAKRAASFSAEASRALESEIRSGIQGEVRFDSGSRALYATDGSNYRQVPIGVVIPKNAADVIATVQACRRHGAPVLSRGGGTSLAGQCCNVAVVMDFSKYMRGIIELDPKHQFARVQPGLVLDVLRDEAQKHHLTFGPDPSTHNHCTLGGMIGNNSCGVHALMSGRTSNNVHALEILTYDGLRMRVGPTSDVELARIIAEGGRRGEIYARLKALRDRYADLVRKRYPKIPRRVSGYNLDELLPENGFNVARALVGTEGTCVTVLEAKLRLVPSPPFRTLLVLGYPDVFQAGDHIPQILEAKPIGLEGLDDRLVGFSVKKKIHPDAYSFLPEGKGWLLAEFGGETQAQADRHAQMLMTRLAALPGGPSMKLFEDKKEEEALWKIRESGLGATAREPSSQPGRDKLTWEGWEDSAVPPERVGDYLRDLRKLLEKHHYDCALYGHFGQGCIHTRIDFDLFTAEGVAKYRSFIEEAADLVVSYGGSLSGEHGDGQSRAELLGKMFGPELVGAFREFKSIWDPEGRMNPGKVVDPFRIDENLRIGPSYQPLDLKTKFKYPEDQGSLPHATLRCVGVGECRRMSGGTMCPSYRATREEKHSTRGRAHLLFEMFRGEAITEGWESEAVKESLDLCLSCKGCKSDCPVNVDMATYKAEFLYHYHKKKPRPITAYTMGLIDVWARLSSQFPDLVNFVTQTPGLSAIAKRIAGIAPERSIPKFARETFKEWFRKRAPKNVGMPEVILWPDTFNNYFHPETAQAAVEVIEAAGFRVRLPRPHLCCGRPLYDYGMLDEAKVYLRRILDVLRPEIRAGVPIVGLEPSCLAVFRDELTSLLPNDQDALRLKSQAFTLSELLERSPRQMAIPRLARKALVQGHCHHKSVLKMKSEESVMKKLGLDFEVLDSGCCGMAGSFGFESEGGRAALSQKIGEMSLLPRIRKESRDTLILADGFSCRTQIEQGTGRRAHHLAEVLRHALRRANGTRLADADRKSS